MNGRTNSHGSSINELQVPLDPCTNLRAEAWNGEVTLYWDDPVDKYATPEGETAQDPQQLVSVWDHTIVVRKVGSQPANPNDGIVVTSSGVRDQYLSTGYTDTSLPNDTTYYYGVFAVNEDGVASDGAFISATPVIGNPLSELAEGTLIKIPENGSPVEFYLAKHNYESDLNGQGRTLVVRKDVHSVRQWNSSGASTYASCSMSSWFNSGYLATLDSNVRSIIGTTKFYYTVGELNWSVKILDRSVFALSATELFGNYDQYNEEGSILPIANELKIAQLNGSPTRQWTRTPRVNAASHSSAILSTETGNRSWPGCAQSYGARPCFTLPSTALVDKNLNLLFANQF